MSKNETILINGDVITLSNRREHPKSLVIRNGKIAAFDPPLPREIGGTEGREIIDLRGKTVIPGLADSHVHFTHVGLGLVFPDFRGATSVEDILGWIGYGLEESSQG